MKWFWYGSIAIGMAVALCAEPRSLYGEENQAVEERIQKLEDENQLLRDLVKNLQKRLEKLEGVTLPAQEIKEDGKKKKKDENSDKQGTAGIPSAGTAAIDLDDRMDIDGGVTQDAAGKGPEWLPSLFGEEFRLGGRLQVEYFNPEQEERVPSARTDYPGGGFHVDELSLYLDGDFKNDIRLHTRFDITGEDQGLVEGYIDFENLYFNSELRIGLQDRFFRPGRYTETYPLPGIAFWRSRVLGATWKGTYDPVYAYVSVTNGTQLGDRQLGEDKSAQMISDDDIEYDMNGDKELSAGLGIDVDFAPYGKLDLLGFGLTGELSSEDVTFLQTEVPGYGFSFNQDKELAGVNLDYGIGEWDLFAQAIAGRDGDLERFAWYTELSYRFQFEGMKFLNSLRPLIRYGELDTNMTPQPFMANGSLTWDREQWLIGAVAELVRNVYFRMEYAFNEEDTGGSDANNNEFLFQLEVRF